MTTPAPEAAPGPAPGEPRRYYGTRAGLAVLRGQWRDLDKAAATAGQLGLPFAAALRAEADAIGAADFSVDVPCLLCHQPGPVTVPVGDLRNAVPGDSMICGPCTARADAEVIAAAEAEGRTPPTIISVPDGIAIVLVDR
jgi:hypothetical protein